MAPERRWVYVGRKPSATEKLSIARICEEFIDRVLKPRFLPEIRPTEYNYPIAIFGKWHDSKYRFIERFRSGFADRLGEEFDSPFARIEYLDRDRFDLSYLRHTGEWLCLYRSLPLATALQTIEDDGHFYPV
jgi:hypothetical protein